MVCGGEGREGGEKGKSIRAMVGGKDRVEGRVF